MVSNECIGKVLVEFGNIHVALISSGVEMDSQMIGQSSGSDVYFTYPESYAEDCKDIQYSDLVYVEGMKGLYGDTRTVSVDIVKRYFYFASILSSVKDFDCDEDVYEVLRDYKDYMDLVQIKLYAKPRKGVVLTREKAERNAAIAETEFAKHLTDMIESYKNGDAYTEV